jgi:hypothetical protein
MIKYNIMMLAEH